MNSKTFKTLLLSATLGVFPLFASSELPRSTPEAQGIPSEAILRIIAATENDPENDLHGLVIVRHGYIVTEGYWAPYSADQKHELFSLSKSFTSTAIGFAVDEGKLDIDTPVINFFPEDVPAEPSEYLKALHLRQLLTMDTGHETEPDIFHSQSDKGSMPQMFFNQPITLKPGTHFLYNTAGTYMLSATLQKTTGKRVLDYLTPRLFEPLDIEGAKWDQSREGVDLGGFGLQIKTMDIAKFGQLLLQKGKWMNKQIIPEKWLDQATSRQVSNGSWPMSDWDKGYGFQFWMNTVGGFRGDGAFGQLCIVLPEYDLVIAVNAGVRDMQKEMRWFWNELLPYLSKEPLPKNVEAVAMLQAKMDTLTLPLPSGSLQSTVTDTIIGKTYLFEKNPLTFKSIRFDKKDDALMLTLENEPGLQSFEIGRGQWAEGMITRTSAEGSIPAFIAGAWEKENLLHIKLIPQGKAHNYTLNLRFEGEEVFLDFATSVSFNGNNMETIIGKCSMK